MELSNLNLCFGAGDFFFKGRRRFLKVNVAKLGPIAISKTGDEAKIVSFGSKSGESNIFEKENSDLLKFFTDRFKNALGPKAEDN